MIHKESNQLFIGPYAIDEDRNVRAMSYKDMPGRHTGNAGHLTDPENKIYYGTMEEGFYEVDVNTLKVNVLYEDGNNKSGRVSEVSANDNVALLQGRMEKDIIPNRVLLYIPTTVNRARWP